MNLLLKTSCRDENPVSVLHHGILANKERSLASNSFLIGNPDDTTTAEATIADLLATAGIGVWCFDCLSQLLLPCPITSELSGLDIKAKLSLRELFVKLSDLRLQILLKRIIIACKAREKFEAEIKIPKRGSLPQRWLKVAGRAYEKGGAITKICGTVCDISGLKEGNIRQRDLMAFMSHELRNPLATAKLYVQQAMRQAAQQKDITLQEVMGKAARQTDRMIGLIDNYLTLSQIEHQQLSLNVTRFDIISMMQEVVSEMAFLHGDYYFKHELALPVWVTADREKITQVLVNYMSNAVKYSPVGSSIYIKCRVRTGKFVVSVHDSGTGIPSEKVKKLFKRYYRTDKKGKGFGLGLFLSKEIIERHGGSVWVKSQVGQGSVFHFSLPA